MDAASIAAATKALQDLWQIGGVVLVLLAILVLFAVAVFVVSVRAWRSMATRLGHVEDDRVQMAKGALAASAAAMHNVAAKLDTTNQLSRDTLAAMHARPCLVASGQHDRPTLPPR